MAHTPGPCEVVPKMTYRNEPHAYEIRHHVPKKRFKIIATTPDGTGGENEANARLIAAAPELLSGAEWAMKYLQDAKKATYDDSAAVPIALAISALHNAIAKATA